MVLGRFFKLLRACRTLTKLEGPTIDYYRLLAVPRTASVTEIKTAYHRALLAFHPDKRTQIASNLSVDISSIKDAYTTLSSPQLRTQYDEQFQIARAPAGPRPAQVISLEEFAEEMTGDQMSWRYSCRCGGAYTIKEVDMDNGQHLVGCSSCSEVVLVGYELADDEE